MVVVDVVEVVVVVGRGSMVVVVDVVEVVVVVGRGSMHLMLH